MSTHGDRVVLGTGMILCGDAAEVVREEPHVILDRPVARWMSWGSTPFSATHGPGKVAF
jgi:hypothetical protein